MSSNLDRLAEAYHLSSDNLDKSYDTQFHQMCLSWIRPIVKRSNRVLQLGYGEGVLASGLITAESTMDIIEGSQILALHAKRSLPRNVSVHNCLFEEFESTEPYDCVVATNILEHVDNPSFVLARIKNWLTEEGVAIVTVPNAQSLHRLLAVEMGIQKSIYELSQRDHLVGHQRVYDMSTLLSQVASAGLRVQERRGFVLKFTSNAQQSTFTPEFLDACHSISPLLPPELLANIGLLLTK